MQDQDVPVKLGFAFDNERFCDRVIHVVLQKSRNQPIAASTEPADGGDPDCPLKGVNATTVAQDPCEDEHVVSRILVSSVILAALSPYFNTLFTNGMADSHLTTIRLVCADDQEAELTTWLLKLMYYNSIKAVIGPEPPLETLLQLAKLAEKYQAEHCVCACDRALAVLPFSIAEFNEVLLICHESFLPDTFQVCCNQIEKHFRHLDLIWHNVQLRDEFLTLSAAALKVIVQSDKVQVFHENTVWRLIERWFAHHRIENAAQLCPEHIEILKLVRYHHMSLEYLTNVVAKTKIMESAEMLGWVLMASAKSRGARLRFGNGNNQGQQAGIGSRRPPPDASCRTVEMAKIPEKARRDWQKEYLAGAPGFIVHEMAFDVDQVIRELASDTDEFRHPSEVLVGGYLFQVGIARKETERPDADQEAGSNTNKVGNDDDEVVFFLEYKDSDIPFDFKYAACLKKMGAGLTYYERGMSAEQSAENSTGDYIKFAAMGRFSYDDLCSNKFKLFGESKIIRMLLILQVKEQ